jgi:hypothetical protein
MGEADDVGFAGSDGATVGDAEGVGLAITDGEGVDDGKSIRLAVGERVADGVGGGPRSFVAVIAGI